MPERVCSVLTGPTSVTTNVELPADATNAGSNGLWEANRILTTDHLKRRLNRSSFVADPPWAGWLMNSATLSWKLSQSAS
jgi:hypothetical protein